MCKVIQKNDELDVRGSITNVFIGWAGTGMTDRIKINHVRNFKQQNSVIRPPHCMYILLFSIIPSVCMAWPLGAGIMGQRILWVS